MALSLSYGYSDTTPAGGATKALSRSNVNYAADFRVRSNTTDDLVITNLKADLSTPETFRFATATIKDVYNGTSIETPLIPPVRRGTSILVQVNDTWTVTDSDDPKYKVALPVSAHLVVKIPNQGIITASNVEYLIGRCLAGLYETDSTDTTRIQSLVRGALAPSTLT